MLTLRSGLFGAGRSGSLVSWGRQQGVVLSGLLLVVWLLPSRAANAQGVAATRSYVHRAWSIDDGLPQNSIYALAQTRDGYLWIGTLQGLVRFDGNRFTVFDTDQTTGLGGNRVSGLLETPDGALWIATSQGLTRYIEGRFRTFTVEDGLPSNNLYRLVTDHEGGFWISTDRGLVHYREGRFTTLTRTDGLPSDAVVTVLEDRAGGLWVGTHAGLAHLQDGIWTVYTAADGLASAAVTELYEPADGSIWVGTEGGVSRFEPVTGRFMTYPIPGYASSVLQDRDGNLWAGDGGGGLLRFEGDGFRPLQLPGDPIGPEVVFLIEDQEGLLWIGTNGSGLHQIKPALIGALLNAPPGRPGPMIHDVIEAKDGAIWATSYAHGVFRIHPDGRVRQYGIAEGLPSLATWTVTEMPDGTVWVGTNHGLARFEGERFRSFDALNAALPTGRIASLHVDRRGDLLIGHTWAGGSLSRLKHRPVPSTQAVGSHDLEVVLSDTTFKGGGGILALADAPDGALWIGTETSGLGYLRDGAFRTFASTTEVGAIRMIARQFDGSLWLGTYGRGLCRFDPGTEQTRCLARAHGLPNNTVHAVLEDGLAFIWLSSNAGLFRLRRADVDAFFRGETAEVRPAHFTRADGMPSTECNGGFQTPGWVTKDGRLLVPTTNGIAVVDPDRVRETMGEALPIKIEAVVANDQVRTPVADLTLPPGNDRLVFEYTAFHFRAPKKLRFRYRLDGQDPEGAWIEAGTARTATYTNLAPAAYHFRLQATLGDGQWDEAALPVRLEPFFYQTTWFRALGALSFLGLLATGVWAYSRRRYRRALARLQVQRALEHERNRISRDMHDEVGASLTEIAILSELARRQDGGGALARGHLEKIVDTSRAMLDALGEIIWAISPENDDLERTVAYLREFAASYLEVTPLNVHLQFPMDVPSAWVSAEFRRNLFLVLKEALHNLVRHAEATHARVTLTVDSDLCLVVQDDGRGFTDERPDGKGLRNMRYRAKAIGGTLAVRSVPGQGTQISLRVRLKKTVPYITQ